MGKWGNSSRSTWSWYCRATLSAICLIGSSCSQGGKYPTTWKCTSICSTALTREGFTSKWNSMSLSQTSKKISKTAFSCSIMNSSFSRCCSNPIKTSFPRSAWDFVWLGTSCNYKRCCSRNSTLRYRQRLRNTSFTRNTLRLLSNDTSLSNLWYILFFFFKYL